MKNSYSLRDTILEEKITTYFQPIVSIKKKKIIGYEGLSRGIDDNGNLIPPLEMFISARQNGLNLQLDRICRKKAIETFKENDCYKDHILFVNFDASILDGGVLGSGWIENLVRKNGVEPPSVAIEIVESHVISQKTLAEFVNIYRDYGFLIVLDDFGTEHSNFDRIFKLKPDIIKIDRMLVKNISQDFYKESIVASIINLAGKIGALTLAEGVETLDEMKKCHELGADFYQGYYLGRPDTLKSVMNDSIIDKINDISGKIMNYMDNRLTIQRKRQLDYEIIVGQMLYALSYLRDDEYGNFLGKCLENYPEIECTYIIDENGTQTGDTIMRMIKKGKVKHHLFSPAEKGTDHSLKTYYFYIKHMNLKRYFTDPYISLATGSLCRTMSSVFKNRAKKNMILCTDFLFEN